MCNRFVKNVHDIQVKYIQIKVALRLAIIMSVTPYNHTRDLRFSNDYQHANNSHFPVF